MSNIWHDISPSRITKDDFIAVIEIEKGSKKKYELDKETGHLILDRILYTSTHYPTNYGLIPRTYADDNDPLDVLVLSSEVIQPLSLVRCYPIGVITMLDQGRLDEKIIAIPFEDPSYNSYHDVSELPAHLFTEISHFFSVYKSLEGKETVVDELRAKTRRAKSSRNAWMPTSKSSAADPEKTPPARIRRGRLCVYFRFSGFRGSRSSGTNRPSFRISSPSKYISPPPYSGVWMHTRSQWMALWLPLGHSS